MNKNFTLDKLIMAGFDYKRSPLEFREKVSFTPDNINMSYEKLKQDNKIKEFVILSTCNRSEIYAVADNAQQGKNCLKSFYARFFGLDKNEIKDYINIRSGEEVIRHLFEVACGFQSLVLGEDHILGQVKDSYNLALEHKATGKFLNRLFLDSITSAKKIKSHTGISENSLSVSSIGVRLIEQELNSLVGKRALVIGFGEMSRIAVQTMIGKNIDKVYIANRTNGKARDFAKKYPNVVEIDFDKRYEIMGDVDIIVSGTSAPQFIVNKESFLEYYKNQPLYMLDLAIPRDIDPSIEAIKGIKLYRIDNLERIAQENIEKRLLAKEKGEKILNHDVKKYINWIEEIKLIDIILSIQDGSSDILTEELSELKNRLGDIDKKQMDIIEESFGNFAKAFISQPMARLKDFVKDNPKFSDQELLESGRK